MFKKRTLRMQLQFQRESKAPPLPDDLRRRFDDVLEHFPSGVTVHDIDGCIVMANHLAAALLGRSEAELIGVHADSGVWHLIDENGRPMAPDDYPVHQVLRTGNKVTGRVVGLPPRPGSGPGQRRPCWMICNAYPETDDDGKLRGAVVCFTDCTELKEAHQRLLKSEERLRLMLE
ncbi:MAG: PAS domain S-box protein, partial [Oxalobacteraceae bacterium]